ncbi:MAG TPA: SDR family NAD(P)-dependent oxidoreductase [Candidatus Binatia bacterium]|nr:SDR family NAD(P)-dependent oxidoreductase [Candidatus Binatia bacterium]
MDLDGRVCVITGGASGIGAAGARRFAEAGARVVVADVDAEHARSVASEVGGTAFAVDVADEAAVDAMVADVVARHGRLDVLWANAGIAGVRAPCAEQPTDAWERVLRVNLTGVFQCFRAALRPMLEAGRGALLATASVAGLRASAGSPAYHAAKAGVVILVQHVAMAYGPRGIRCNALCPGLTDTPILDPFAASLPGGRQALFDRMLKVIPSRRAGRPSDIADAALFLASDAASYVNGVALRVDGGLGV